MRKNLWVLTLALLVLFPVTGLLAAKGSSAKADTVVTVSREPAAQTIEQGLKEFNSLKKSEKKSRLKEMKKAIKQFKEDRKAGKDVDTNLLLLIVLSILIPPLAVYLHEGEINARFWISVLLTILGYLLFGFAGIFFLGSLPGIIYALIVVLRE